MTITPTRSMDNDVIFCIAEHYLLKKSQQLIQNITLDLNCKYMYLYEMTVCEIVHIDKKKEF